MNTDQLFTILASIKSSVADSTWSAAVARLSEPESESKTKPKRVLTEEHKAKMQAGRIAKKAEKAENAENAEKAEKPKRVLTEEHKAKMQAGRIAKKAEKAEKAESEKPEKPKRVLTEEHKAKMQAGRIAKKALAVTIPPNPVVEAMSANPVTESIKVGGKSYIRLADGRCYEPSEIEGELGAWAGLFKDGVLDTTARED
jgi:hypothetical protein